LERSFVGSKSAYEIGVQFLQKIKTINKDPEKILQIFRNYPELTLNLSVTG
jgi:hypothetical protein